MGRSSAKTGHGEASWRPAAADPARKVRRVKRGDIMGIMAYIDLVPVDRATGPLRKMYDAALQRAGRVYEIVRTMSPNPPVLEASMALYTKVMKGPSGLSRRERELLATVTSRINECHY